MTGRPTIYDVARAAGLAPSTVSRALTRPGRVSAHTAERVRRIAAELGYTRAPAPGPVAPGQVVALMTCDITNPHVAEIVRGAEQEAARRGYTVLLCDTRESPAREADVLRRVLPVVDGVVLASSRLSDAEVGEAARTRPTVVINRSLEGVPTIVLDHAQGAHLAIDHLHGLGHRSVGYVPGPATSPVEDERSRGLERAARERDVGLVRLRPASPTLEGGAGAGAELVRTGVGAVIGYNDLIAIGLLQGLARRGVRVPDDVSVVGFDNIDLGRVVRPRLTSVGAPLRTLGESSMRNLLQRLTTPGRGTVRTARLPVGLVVRGSTGPPAQAGPRSR
ncbi:LacI family DNA-binding transcriptional regulator [Pseudonocardia sp. ICBG1293]|uniref:LacI family DNA-binding transcriptional regulator n=1 Tax=Pseudonocardia sp. ICBG1293 TaxID=2844382 RepID=UPI001CCBBDC2|nr:LacI family DNA-binding transcriptional regulator [Pseudonocardia sp. ICBG1293]